ncbi:MAG: hypothetical protein ACFCBU_10225 [Cyanophyceae cyanobacterium]
MAKTYAQNQLKRAQQYRAAGYDSAAKDAADRGLSNLSDRDVPAVSQETDSAVEAIAELKKELG